MNTRWLFSLAVVFPIGAALGACATGSSYSGAGGEGGSDPVTQGPGPTSAASSGTGGAGQGGANQGGAGQSGSSTTTGPGSSSSTGGGQCETPCGLTPQCGCAAGEGCTIDGTGAHSCQPSGNVQPGGNCSLDNCAPGGLCLGGATPTCGEFCKTDSQCDAPGGLCVVGLNDGNGSPIPGVTLCSENCNPTTNSGCISGTGCTFGQEPSGQMRFFTACRGIGSGTQGAACTTNADCAATYGCINTGTKQCMKYCTVGSTCAGGAACSPITINMLDIIIGGVQYGICP